MNIAADIYQYTDDETRTRILTEYRLRWKDLLDAQRRQPGWNRYLETGKWPTPNGNNDPSNPQ